MNDGSLHILVYLTKQRFFAFFRPSENLIVLFLKLVIDLDGRNHAAFGDKVIYPGP